MTLAWRYAARTDVGLVRSRNEDSGYAGPHLLVLADGMGGHAAGNVASSLAVGEMVHLDGDAYGADEAMELSGSALRGANKALRDAMRADPALRGMGTTVTALLRTGNKVVLTHIGDSRAYLARDGQFAQISRDHSFVQALVDEGRISADEAMHHPQRSLVTRVLTGQQGDQPDLSVREARPGDRYLLCSDGLSDYVAEDTICEVLVGAAGAAEAADRLVQLALKAGAPDNVTCIVADVVDIETDVSTPTQPQVVGAAAERPLSTTQAMPLTPAAKAAALTRSVTPGGGDEGPDAPDAVVPPGSLGDPGGSAAGAGGGAGISLAEEHPSRRARWIRGVGLLVLVLVAIGGGGFAAYTWSQQQWFVGQARGRVAIYRGVAQQIGSWRLSHVTVETDIATADLPEFYRNMVRTHVEAASEGRARQIVLDLSGQALRCQQLRASGGPCVTGP